MLEESQIKIVMLLHELEKSMGDLYVLFSEHFPEHDNLWKVLIKEELEHAEAVRTLYKLTYEDESSFDEGGLKCDGVQAIIDHIKENCDRAINGRFTALQAVSTTYDIESSILDKDLFTHFEVSQHFTEMIQYLRNGSEFHAQLAKRELDKIRKDK